jgi:hypothetical protein
MSRIADLERFYELLGRLELRAGGKRALANSNRREGWPERGVYFFFEPGEQRSDSGNGLRVVRVGTHAIKLESSSSLWQRLSQHKGTRRSGGGNHRGSIFRLLVGTALIAQGFVSPPASWNVGNNARQAAARLGMDEADLLSAELPLEIAVSAHLRSLPFLWLEIGDAPGPQSDRGLIERNSIALLSNYNRPALDPPSPDWLGRSCDRERVRRSGLWNNRHVDENYEPTFLSVLEQYLSRPEA